MPKPIHSHFVNSTRNASHPFGQLPVPQLCAGTFAELYRDYSTALFGVIQKILKNATLSEDALQNTFLKIWLHRKDYDASKSRLFTWMLNIARNEAIDVLRSKTYRNALATVALNGNAEAAIVISPLISLDHCDLKKKLHRLNPKDRAIIELCFFRGFTCNETAAIMGMPSGTVKTRMQCSYKKLRPVLEVVPS